jgi:hypothetical protein
MAIILPNYAGDGAITEVCTCYGKVMQPPSSEHRGVVAL